MHSPKVSVIVPVYNVEKYLSDCIDSIMSQTFTDFELLLVDDGSTDSSGQICNKYAKIDARIKVFHKSNGGVSSARNFGLDKAEGEWICFCDSDDIIKSEYLSSMVNNIVTKNSLILSSYYGRGGLKVELSEGTVCGKEMVKLFIEQKWMFISAPYSKLYNRNIIKVNNICFPNNIYMGEDAIFILRYINVIDAITTVNACNYFVRTVTGSLSSKYYSFQSEWTCYQIWRKELLYFINRYGKIYDNPVKVVWATRVGSTFTRCIQCLYKQERVLTLREQVKSLRKIPYKDYNEYKLYYHPNKFSQRIFKLLVECRFLFICFLFIKNCVRKLSA